VVIELSISGSRADTCQSSSAFLQKKRLGSSLTLFKPTILKKLYFIALEIHHLGFLLQSWSALCFALTLWKLGF